MSFSDGPHGIRRQEGAGDHLGLNESLKATCFPMAATVANSWDEELGKEIGKALGEEALCQKVDDNGNPFQFSILRESRLPGGFCGKTGSEEGIAL